MELSLRGLPAVRPAVGAPGVRGHQRAVGLDAGRQGDVVLPVLETKGTITIVSGLLLKPWLR